jgi:hypothetical protein
MRVALTPEEWVSLTRWEEAMQLNISVQEVSSQQGTLAEEARSHLVRSRSRQNDDPIISKHMDAMAPPKPSLKRFSS